VAGVEPGVGGLVEAAGLGVAPALGWWSAVAAGLGVEPPPVVGDDEPEPAAVAVELGGVVVVEGLEFLFIYLKDFFANFFPKYLFFIVFPQIVSKIKFL
jgi:hypothetical protein